MISTLLPLAFGTLLSVAPPQVPPAAPRRPSAAAETPPVAPLSPQRPRQRPKPPEQRYVSRGVRSRFCFGVGLHMGVNSLRSKRPLLGGASFHFRMSGVAGVSVEYDFNRVAQTPDPDDLSISSLHFIPNLRVGVVLIPYRWRMLGPYLFLGLGIDTVSDDGRTNYQLGLGLEVTFWKDRLAVLGEFRAFLPRASDVEKLRERRQISGTNDPLKTGAYYAVENFLFTLSVRFYY